MSLEPQGEDVGRDAADEAPQSIAASQTDAAQLADVELQEKYRKEYLAQLRRRSCPECGEDFSSF
ncbi:hypothetical protein [Aeoliella sp. SH292]|uniref:hypothetical protein n=1 Tax=Aeoliella sp. SH292 TaxID=3454464 RepID=UPI003F96BE66